MLKFKLKSIAALAFVLFFGLQVFASNQSDYKKEYHENFTVNKDVILNVSNKFGFVKIVTSETDQITIDVVVKVEAKNAEKAQKLLDQIEIRINGNAEQVSAETIFSKDSKFKELSIDYTITMPVSGNLDLTNKFGSFYLNELNGNSKIAVSYGSLDIGNLNSQSNDITVKFGSGKVKYAQYLNYYTRYSEVRIGRAKLLNLDTQYGGAKVGEVGRMDLKSAYADVELGTIVELKAEMKFGDLEIEGIISSFELEAQYGDVEVDFISKDFTDITIHSSFGDVELAFQSGSNFNLKGRASYGDINIPGGTISNVSESGGKESYDGKMFEGVSPSTVTARMSYGDLDIRIH